MKPGGVERSQICRFSWLRSQVLGCPVSRKRTYSIFPCTHDGFVHGTCRLLLNESCFCLAGSLQSYRFASYCFPSFHPTSTFRQVQNRRGIAGFRGLTKNCFALSPLSVYLYSHLSFFLNNAGLGSVSSPAHVPRSHVQPILLIMPWSSMKP